MTVAHQNYKATTVAATRPPHELAASHREDLLAMLEPDPLLLLGGDEITISLPHAFEQLGLVHVAVERLQSLANARVAVTRTGKGEGAAGHDRAMKASESAHDILKTYEQLARDLHLVKARLDPRLGLEADDLARTFETLHSTLEPDGQIAIRDPHGASPPNSQAGDAAP